MKHKLLAATFLTITLLCGHADLRAQEMPPSWVDGTTQTRLKAVYDRGEFRATGYPAKWSSDSSVWQADCVAV